MRKVEDVTTDLIEIIKYGSKIFTEPDLKKKNVKSQSRFIYISALDNILTAMAGRRIFERFGFNLSPRGDARQTGGNTVLTKYDKWIFVQKCADWINAETGEPLAGYELNSELLGLLKNNLNLILE